MEVKTHLLDLETGKSFCDKAILGDKAITLEQARDPSNGLYFDCEDCYEIVSDDDSDKSG